jgi:hypothetical protein
VTTGWVCPKCERVYGPTMLSCVSCNEWRASVTSANGSLACVHAWVEHAFGTRCEKCGVIQLGNGLRYVLRQTGG